MSRGRAQFAAFRDTSDDPVIVKHLNDNDKVKETKILKREHII